MEGKVEAFVVSFFTVILCLIFYRQVVKSYTPRSIQGWIGI
jgi:hypothetical protein